MNVKSEEPKDQADELRNLFQEIEEGQAIEPPLKSTDSEQESEAKRDIDILNLPPRKEIHSKDSRTSLKLSGPLIRLLFVIFILILGLAGAYYIWGNEFWLLIKELS
ncbi:sulfite exporter TauE/SafE family protein [Oceanobacillus polygoni]|uniref:Uncharacterized protein n=1 Tax=Oceanobacillus polygoni TaxID=1235259 RepID=A0A9X1CHK5_9BACI|nr:sulfite exporter TauE/SafE family protein [Oceanobacillus polygoni]MBP2077832.1 hypothetical protein [Oceanobacillus polygoni]